MLNDILYLLWIFVLKVWRLQTFFKMAALPLPRISTLTFFVPQETLQEYERALSSNANIRFEVRSFFRNSQWKKWSVQTWTFLFSPTFFQKLT